MFIETAKRILIIVSERIGDAIFCTPAVALLKKIRPEVKIGIVALAKSTAEVYQYNPDVDQIYVAPDKDAFQKLKEEYDVLVDLHNSNASAGEKNTMHYVSQWGETAYISPRAANGAHQSEVAVKFIQSLFHVDLIGFDDSYRLFPQPEHFERVKILLKESGADLAQQPLLIGCHMGCYKTASRLKKFWKKNFLSNKGWEIKNFAAIQKMLYQHNPKAKLVLTGVPSEGALTKYLHQDIPNVVNLIGKTSVLEMAALMTMLKVFLTGDTGPLHVAVSTKVPVVALFGSTYPELTGPRPVQSQHHIIFKQPMAAITPEEVFGIIKGYV